MKKNLFLLGLLIFLSLSTAFSLIAQPPPGRGPGGFDPDEMIKREKQNVYKAVTDLSDDQKLLLDGIYDEYALSFKELRDEMRQTRDFQAMRPKMEALNNEKDELIKDVLAEDQYQIYQELIDKRNKQMRENAERRGNPANQPVDGPPVDGDPSQDPIR